MELLSVQLQPARSPGLDASAALARLASFAGCCSVHRCQDAGPDITVVFTAADLAGLWAAIRQQLRADPALSAAAIVVCQGEHGWDDYLLLHHFDPSQPLDELGA